MIPFPFGLWTSTSFSWFHCFSYSSHWKLEQEEGEGWKLGDSTEVEIGKIEAAVVVDSDVDDDLSHHVLLWLSELPFLFPLLELWYHSQLPRACQEEKEDERRRKRRSQNSAKGRARDINLKDQEEKLTSVVSEHHYEGNLSDRPHRRKVCHQSERKKER